MKRIVTIDYATINPKIGANPVIVVRSEKFEMYKAELFDDDTGELVTTAHGVSGKPFTINWGRQWYTNWHVKVYLKDTGELIYEDKFDPTGKLVFIKMDSRALGDNIAWMPYIREFKEKHNCNVICSTFFNTLFYDAYPDITFVEPKMEVHNVYARYFIGVLDNYNKKYSPVRSTYGMPLQQIASEILQLEHKEIRPDLSSQLLGYSNPKKVSGDYVCISEKSSGEIKEWKGDWQKVVDSLVDDGIKVVVVSKEKTNLKRVIDYSGCSLLTCMSTIIDAKVFIGVSSGLSWMAWASGTHCVMISDITPIDFEFKSGITRLSENPELKSIDFFAKGVTSEEKVIESIKKQLA